MSVKSDRYKLNRKAFKEYFSIFVNNEAIRYRYIKNEDNE